MLQNIHNGPTDLLMSKGILKMGDKEVPLMQIGIADRTRKVTDYSIIPAQSETVMDVNVERKECDDSTGESEYIIEPTEHFQEEYPLLMAAAVVDINQGCKSKVRLLNPFPTEVSIKQSAVLGQAEPIERTSGMQDQQEVIIGGNYNSIRKIRLLTRDDILSPEGNVKQSKRVNETKLSHIPKHLASLYEESSASLKIDEQAELKALPIKFQESFSKIKWDPGGTNLPAMDRENRIGHNKLNPFLIWLKEVQKALLLCSQ